MTETRPVRITSEAYKKAKKLMDEEKDRGTPMGKALTITETSWFSNLVDIGCQSYLHDRKMDRGAK